MSKWTVIIAAILGFTVAVVLAYLLRPQGKTDDVIASIEQSADESRQRAQEIVTSTVKKEVSARVETRKNTALLSDDELLDAINQMLREYRAGITY